MYRRKRSLFALSVVVLLLAPASATLQTGLNVTKPEWFFDGFIPAAAGISAECTTAYSSQIDCDDILIMSENISGKRASLEITCAKSCLASLLLYQNEVKRNCASENLEEKNLERTWLNMLIQSTASLTLYYRQCLRDLTSSRLCSLTDFDYELAWEAASPISADQNVVDAFCKDSCLTQSVVLNAPTEENLQDLARMCPNGFGLNQFPFLENMKDAGVVTGDEAIFGNLEEDSLIPGSMTGADVAEAESIGSTLTVPLKAIVTAFLVWICI